jgi:hypothetical protein
MKKPMIQPQTRPAVSIAALHPATPPEPSVVTAPQQADIARLAYDIYVKTGRQPGHCTRNWHQAEQALREQALGYGYPTH